MNCPKCNTPLADGAQFCENCGEKVVAAAAQPQTIFCPNCGMQTSSEFAYCQNCGASVAEKKPKEPKEPKTPKESKPVQIPKKLIGMGVAAVAVILVIVLLASLIFGGSSKNNYALYIKDSEIYYNDFSGDPMQVTNRLFDMSVSGLTNAYLESNAYEIGYYNRLSADGKILFFVDKIDATSDSSGAYSLFYRYINKPKQEAVKIDSDVLSYVINEKANCVTYLKKGDTENVLYQHDLKEKEKIDSGVDDYYVSDDGKKIIYTNIEGNLYLKNSGKDKEKLESEVTSIQYIDEKLSTVYFVKEDSLYKKSGTKDKEKIASGVNDVLYMYESGEMYYTKSEAGEVSLLNYVEDDKKDADAAMTEPTRPSRSNYSSTTDYNAAYAAYQTARDEYDAKVTRDSLRTTLSEMTMEQQSYTLCYFDGKEEKVITESYVEYSSRAAEERAVIVYKTYNQTSVSKVKLSEITNVYDVQSMVTAALYSASDYYIAIKEAATLVDTTEGTAFDIDEAGKNVYYIDDISEPSTDSISDYSTYGDLYKIEISKTVGKAELFDSDVSTYYSYFVADDQYLYFKDVKDGKGELYINKTKIDYDVRIAYVSYLEDSKKVAYYTDWSTEKQYGTLKTATLKGKTTKVADDVHSYRITPDEQILYIYDFSLTSYKGELYLFKGKKAEKIDDDVVAILPIIQMDN